MGGGRQAPYFGVERDESSMYSMALPYRKRLPDHEVQSTGQRKDSGGKERNRRESRYKYKRPRVWERRPHEPSPFYPSRPSSSVRRISRPSSHAPSPCYRCRAAFPPSVLLAFARRAFILLAHIKPSRLDPFPLRQRSAFFLLPRKAKVSTFEGLPSSWETSRSKKTNPPFLFRPGAQNTLDFHRGRDTSHRYHARGPTNPRTPTRLGHRQPAPLLLAACWLSTGPPSTPPDRPT
jgi:hypothetical protein